MNNNPKKCLLTMESAVILNRLQCSCIFKDECKFYITEVHSFILKETQKKYNFDYIVDKNNEDTNEPPLYYNQNEDINSVLQHYHFVLETNQPTSNKIKNIWDFLCECTKNYTTAMLPKCKNSNEDGNCNDLKNYHNDKKLCLSSKLSNIDGNGLKDIIPDKDYDKVIKSNEYNNLIVFKNKISNSV